MSQHVYSLDGSRWVIAADSNNVGREQEWYREPRPDATLIRVPGILQEALPKAHGVVWYWLDVTFPAHPYAQGRYLLRFNAVDYLADVWLNGKYLGGHEGGETPFVFDATDAIQVVGHNWLAVRVLNPVNEPIDGIVLAETPHRNKSVNFTVGGSLDIGGITESVELLLTPPVYITGVHVREDWHDGRVAVETTVRNTLPKEAPGRVVWVAGPAATGESCADSQESAVFKPGDTVVSNEFVIVNHHLWDVEDPFLYRLTTRLMLDEGGSSDEHVARFGFRELRVDKGYFRLNARRVFWRSSHTGNHCPVGQVVPPDSAPDLLRRDLIYMKASGFNAVRFISGVPHPWQLDLCDEIGLMVYEENYASWLLGDSPKMKDRFDLSLVEMVRR
ncbi:MAG: glycoside hydrolase family 2, partial [Candidatus Hydrogenedentes bacterium]|nr:glycoside hydrolase family 2 [Candidatus Hydrogenedentota bacterium]